MPEEDSSMGVSNPSTPVQNTSRPLQQDQQEAHRPTKPPGINRPNGLENSVFNPILQSPLSRSQAPLLGLSKPPQLPDFANAEEAIYYAQHAIIKAASLAANSKQQDSLVDLMGVFRSYTNKGYVLHQTQLQETVQSLETQIKTLSRRTMNPKTTKEVPAQKTYSETASSAPADPQSTGPPPVKTFPLKSRQTILVRLAPFSFDPATIRDKINRSFITETNYKGPVVCSVVKARATNNIIITTMPTITSQWFLENKNVWTGHIPHERAQPNHAWFKVAVHGIPLKHHHQGVDILPYVKDEIQTFNQDLKVQGNPFWLTSEQKRNSGNQTAGSVCIAFSTEAEAKRAISKGLFIAGTNHRVEKMISVPQSTQCKNCQGFGHIDKSCTKSTSCGLCAKPHRTEEHMCSSCSVKGTSCEHSIYKCSNCDGNHAAMDRLQCEVYQSTRTRPTTLTTTSSAIPANLIPIMTFDPATQW